MSLIYIGWRGNSPARILMLVLLLVLGCFSPIICLTICPSGEDLSDPSKDHGKLDVKECLRTLAHAASRHSQFYLRPLDSSSPLLLPCLRCNSSNSPVWYFIRRNSAPLFGYSASSSDVLVLKQRGSLVDDDQQYCLSGSSGGLLVRNFDPERSAGTYYCQVADVPSAGSVWHHVDTIYPADHGRFSRLVLTKQARGSNKARSALVEIESTLKQQYPTEIFKSNLLRLFYKMDPRPILVGLCGDVRLQYIRRCYIQVPRNITDARPLTESEFAVYAALKEAAAPFEDFKTMSEKKDGRAFTAAKNKAINMAEALGFQIDESNSDMTLPCHFSLLKQIRKEAGMGNPFDLINPFGKVVTKISCPQVDPLEIVKLAMTRDINKLRMRVMGEVRRSMRSVDRLYVEGAARELLTCGFSELFSDSCNRSWATVQWRRQDDYVLTVASVLGERVFVASDCRLQFTDVKRSDSGTYFCFRRATDGRHWQISPTTKFLVQVERAGEPLPSVGRVARYFAVLVLWTAVLTGLWALLTVVRLRLKASAKVRAEERRRLLQGRARQRGQKGQGEPMGEEEATGGMSFISTLSGDAEMAEIQESRRDKKME